MCSIMGGLTIFNSTSTNADDMLEWCEAFTLFARVFAYIGVMGLMMIVIFLIMKYITEIGEDDFYDVRNNETNPLRQAKETEYSYGTSNNVGDLEAGYYSGSSSNCNNNNSNEELYDGKLCVICYDEERNCFFVPCGHCATCYHCAQRIFDGENKVCPVCRRFIGKVRRLFAS